MSNLSRIQGLLGKRTAANSAGNTDEYAAISGKPKTATVPEPAPEPVPKPEPEEKKVVQEPVKVDEPEEKKKEMPVVHEQKIEESDDDDEEEEEGEEGDDDDDEESSEEEAEEPILKYKRLGGNVPEILQKEAASCVVIHPKFLILGTQEGRIYQLDFHGTVIQSFMPFDTFVSQVAIDSTGEWLASSSFDGKVFIQNLLGPEKMEYTFDRPLTVLALDPQFSKRRERPFIVGDKGGAVTICSRGILGRKKEVTIFNEKGEITALRWRGNFIAWCTQNATHVYDVSSGSRLGKVLHPDVMPPRGLYRTSLCWESDTSLLIGIGNRITVVEVRRKSSAVGVTQNFMGADTTALEIVVVQNIQVNNNICGVCPYGANALAVFTHLEDDKGNKEPPEMLLIQRNGEEITTDGLPVSNFKSFRAMDYCLEYLDTESVFFLVTPRDIIVANTRDLDDHIQWLIEQDNYSEALGAAQRDADKLHRYTVQIVGQAYMNKLLQDGAPDKAAKLCPGIVGSDKSLWEDWILRFHHSGNLKYITKFVPQSDPKLDMNIYSLVLNEHLRQDHESFLTLVLDWDSSNYDVSAVITSVTKELRNNPNDVYLLKALAKLYDYAKLYSDEINVYLKLKEGPVFEIIKEHKLYSMIGDRLSYLFDFNEEQAVALLVDAKEQISPEIVMAQLDQYANFQLSYLDALVTADSNQVPMYHGKLVELYANFKKEKLLTFLQMSNSYNLEDALSVCHRLHLFREEAFILERMGSSHEALNVLIDKVKNMKAAVDLVQRQDDDDLKQILIQKSLHDPLLLSELLENIGSLVDPIVIIKNIPDNMEIPRLSEHLVKLMSDHSLQMSLYEGCNTILRTDCVELFDTLVAKKRRAFSVSATARCATCNGLLCRQKHEDVVVFGCSHAYHRSCLQNACSRAASEDSEGQKGAQMQGSGEEGQKLWCAICKSAMNKRILEQRQKQTSQQQQQQQQQMRKGQPQRTGTGQDTRRAPNPFH